MPNCKHKKAWVRDTPVQPEEIAAQKRKPGWFGQVAVRDVVAYRIAE